MKIALATFALFLTQLVFAQNKTTTYYLIRHAEKADNSRNPDLSAAGTERAVNWNRIFAAIPFDAIYSTDYKRTLQTATPTAEKNKAQIILYNPQVLSFPDFKKSTSGKTVLIVGHSNTIPAFANQLIGKTIYNDIEDTVFGNLYIITVNGDSVTHQLLKLP
ncbi:SixA phosphatase family protein [Flavobacterium humi]|uniref:Phosphoglycerate mutase n=1 Tax=Flavobacterium humi TaxID=2562683 RepID=A0A4Z0L6T9_9FLAO|nr:phosphoglycerate mutase family protein [Flavobacterium humi]TGD58216.1 phosphoglycerate mutase [Flavobacterium humi]